MTTNEGRVAPDAEVRAAAERWARAAGVPVSAGVGVPPRCSPVALRFLRGVLLGALVGTLVLLIGSAAGAVPVLALLLGVAVACTGARTTLERRRARTAAGR